MPACRPAEPGGREGPPWPGSAYSRTTDRPAAVQFRGHGPRRSEANGDGSSRMLVFLASRTAWLAWVRGRAVNAISGGEAAAAIAAERSDRAAARARSPRPAAELRADAGGGATRRATHALAETATRSPAAEEHARRRGAGGGGPLGQPACVRTRSPPRGGAPAGVLSTPGVAGPGGIPLCPAWMPGIIRGAERSASFAERGLS